MSVIIKKFNPRKMKITNAFIILLLAVSVNAFCQNILNDTIYFCREYKNGREVGLSDLFAISSKGESITVMLRTKVPVKESSLRIKIEKIMPDTSILISNNKFDVQPDWDYIFFSNIRFPYEGFYRAGILRADGSEIASNTVTIVNAGKK
jgi:hypothetical protein